MSPWGQLRGLVHNLQIPQNTRFLRTRFYVQERPSSVGVLQPYFKSSKGISCTSLCRGILNKICLQIFFLRFAQHKKTKKWLPTATYEDNFSRVLNQEFFFWFTSSRFCKQPILFEVLAPTSLFLWGSHMRREYHKRTTLRSKSSTIKGLLYAPVPDNCEKGMLSDQPRLSCITSTALLCCWGRSRSKIWRPSWLTLRHMPYGRGTLRIPLQRILQRGRPALSPWAKREEAVIRQATINLIHEFGNPLGIPYPSCTA